MAGLSGSAIGVLLAGIVVGYTVNEDIMNGIIHGDLIGIVGAIILFIIPLLIGQTLTLIAVYVGLTTNGSIVLAVIMSAIGGAIVCHHWKKNIKFMGTHPNHWNEFPISMC